MPGLGDNGIDTFYKREEAPFTFPNGCHAAEVEIDPDTGSVKLVNYVMVDDYGTLVNPALTEGQLHGGVVQGIGQALEEFVAFDPESGQLLSGSFNHLEHLSSQHTSSEHSIPSSVTGQAIFLVLLIIVFSGQL